MASVLASIHRTHPPGLNYYDASTTYFLKNQFTGKLETAYAQDWRRDWKKTGELMGDKLPVIRVTGPAPLQSYLVRPYHAKNKAGAYVCDQTAEKIVLFLSPLFINKTVEMRTGEGESEVETCALEPVYTKPLHSDASAKEKADGKASSPVKS